MLEGRLTISRWSGTSGTGIRIQLEDKSSGVMLTDIELTPEVLGLALTGQSSMPCTYRDSREAWKSAGKTLEVKHETLVGVPRDQMTRAEADKYIKPYEVDGWQVNNWEDINNTMHKRSGDKAHMTFFRYVDAT